MSTLKQSLNTAPSQHGKILPGKTTSRKILLYFQINNRPFCKKYTSVQFPANFKYFDN